MKLTALSFIAFFWATGAQCEEHHAHLTVAPVASAPRLVVEAPNPDYLPYGALQLAFHTENIKIMPLYGDTAKALKPPIGHLHVTIDNASWHWVHDDNEPITLAGLKPGPHTITLELADPNHAVLETHQVNFVIPPP